MHEGSPLPRLRCRGGTLSVDHWPAALALPPGMRRSGQHLYGPGRLRRELRERLAEAGSDFTDDAELPPLATANPSPADPTTVALLQQWQRHDGRGIFLGLPQHLRLQLVTAAQAACRAPTLLLVPDSAAARLWQTLLGEATAVTALPLLAALQNPGGNLPPHELLVADPIELLARTPLELATDRSPALWRLGLAHTLPGKADDWTPRLGPCLGFGPAADLPTVLVEPVAMPPAVAAEQAEAWHQFLSAYDREAARGAVAGFATFVQRARSDPELRPALLAWHRAHQLAAWHLGKAAAVTNLLAQHRGRRTLVFTPDRASAYAIARQHLIAPVTAELPAAERQATLRAFQRGALPALVGPRLLDLGIAEGAAEIGILVGGGNSAAQRLARLRRIAPTGLAYELVSRDTPEVGRAHRARAQAAQS